MVARLSSIRVHTSADTDVLRARLDGLTIRDAHRLARKVDRLRRGGDPAAFERLDAEIATARGAHRDAAAPRCPTVTYPPELPVSARREELLRGDRATTRSSSSRARPARARRRSCRSSASSSAAACAGRSPTRSRGGSPRARSPSGSPTSSSVPLGEAVGYAVRFSDRSREDTLVRLMTDGLLLAEIQRDRLLRRYDTIIVDEAHERSLNIDFLLGYLHRILPQRPDLKLIITSATIDPERFAAHFGDAPVVEVSGRTYPVEIRHRPVARGRRPGRRDRRRGRGARCARAPATCSCSSAASARSATPPTALRGRLGDRRRGPAALRAAVHRRAAARLPAPHGAPPRRAGHERRRDLADRARDPLRRRSRDGAHQPLQRAAEGAAAADRADLAGLGRPAQGPLRAHVGRHLHPPLRRGGLRRRARASPTPRSCARTSPR